MLHHLDLVAFDNSGDFLGLCSTNSFYGFRGFEDISDLDNSDNLDSFDGYVELGYKRAPLVEIVDCLEGFNSLEVPGCHEDFVLAHSFDPFLSESCRYIVLM